MTVSTTTTTTRANLPHRRCTRTKLLNSLGLFREDQLIVGSSSSSSKQQQKQVVVSCLVLSKPYSSGSLSSLLSSVTRNNNNNKIKKKKSVRFNEITKIYFIPSRYEYSDIMKRQIWNSADEIMKMANRNTIEFEWENWDWKNVVLEEDMYVDAVNGQSIHPSHIANLIAYYSENDLLDLYGECENTKSNHNDSIDVENDDKGIINTIGTIMYQQAAVF